MGSDLHPTPGVPPVTKAGDLDARRCGQIDTTDLVVGIALLVIVPVLVYFVGAFFIEDHYVEPMGKKAAVEAPPDEEEVRMYLVEASDLLTRNAPRYLDLMKATTDAALRDKYRQWAQRALVEGLSKLDEVRDFLIKNHPEGSSVFGAELQKIARMRAEASAELKRVQELDVLGGR